MGSYVPGVKAAGFGGTGAGAVPTFTQLPGIRAIPGIGAGVPQAQATSQALTGDAAVAEQIAAADRAKKSKSFS